MTNQNIAAQVEAIRDAIGEHQGPDIREHVLNLCNQIALLAHRVDAIEASQDENDTSPIVVAKMTR